jgi:hypothetical protein
MMSILDLAIQSIGEALDVPNDYGKGSAQFVRNLVQEF